MTLVSGEADSGVAPVSGVVAFAVTPIPDLAASVSGAVAPGVAPFSGAAASGVVSVFSFVC